LQKIIQVGRGLHGHLSADREEPTVVAGPRRGRRWSTGALVSWW